MSDAEADVEYEEEEAEETPRQEKPKPKLSKREESERQKSEAEAIMLAQKKKHEEEEVQKLKEYEEQRRIQREKEEEELRQLKEKQERRRQEREEEERVFAEKRREDEEKRRREEEERKKKADEEKRKKEEEKKKKAAMMAGLKSTGVTIEIQKREGNVDKISKFGNIVKAKAEMGLTREQHEEQKRKHLQDVVKDLRVDNLDVGALRAKLKEMHQRICRLEATRYDLQKRQERQEYDLKELNERQRQFARNKALKKGLDPDEAVAARHPPAAVPHFPHCLPPPPTDTRSNSKMPHQVEKLRIEEEDKAEKQKAVFHGSARPPSTWGRRDNEELEQIRRNLEPPKYAETVKLENVRPPAPYVASVVPEDINEEEE